MKRLALVTMLVTAAAACATDGGGDDDGGGGDDAPPFTNGVSMLSGAADAGYIDGARGEARFANPVNVAFGPDGRVYVADFDNGKIRVVDADTGETSTLISQENFKRPFAMVFDGNTLYVTTDYNSKNMKGPLDGSVWRVQNGVATVIAEGIGKPRGIGVLPDGRLVVADYQHHVIQTIDPATGAVTKLAGTWDTKGMVDGAASKFAMPYGLVVRGSEIIVADHENNRIRAVGLDGSVRTLAGGAAGFADGAMASAQFDHPQGIALTSSGDLYITDINNYRVRRISGDSVETIAGSGQGGYLDSDDRLSAQLYGLEGLAVTADGSMVFVADGDRGDSLPYNRVRSIKMQ
jgi:sugar lactone lactonase YvrE